MTRKSKLIEIATPGGTGSSLRERFDQSRKPDGPNYNELQRCEDLSDKLYKAVNVARHFHYNRVSVDLETAEEILQTAKQIIDQNH